MVEDGLIYDEEEEAEFDEIASKLFDAMDPIDFDNITDLRMD